MRWSIVDRNFVASLRQWLGRAQCGTKVLRKFLTRSNQNWNLGNCRQLSYLATILYLYQSHGFDFDANGQPQTQDQQNENRMVRAGAFTTWWAIHSSPASGAQSKPAADLIIHNAKVWTVDKDRPTAQAVAVLGDRIVAVGSNAEVEAWHGPQTRTIDASSKLLLPGFNDSHVHFVDGGLSLDSAQLNDATSATEFARRIGEQARNTPKGEWVTSGDWDETKWTPAAMPTKDLITLTPDTPVFVSRYDGHMAVANSVTLKLAGITAQTPDPPGGVIVHDAQGNPTGALKDAAMDSSKIRRRHARRPDAGGQARLGACRLARRHQRAAHEPRIRGHRRLLRMLERGELTARIYAAPLITGVDDQVKIGIRHAFGGQFLRIGALKALPTARSGRAPRRCSIRSSTSRAITAASSRTKCTRQS